MTGKTRASDRAALLKMKLSSPRRILMVSVTRIIGKTNVIIIV